MFVANGDDSSGFFEMLAKFPEIEKLNQDKKEQEREVELKVSPVSYTHLTLPTILLV